MNLDTEYLVFFRRRRSYRWRFGRRTHIGGAGCDRRNRGPDGKFAGEEPGELAGAGMVVTGSMISGDNLPAKLKRHLRGRPKIINEPSAKKDVPSLREAGNRAVTAS